MTTIDVGKLHSTTDAKVWAEEFCGRFSVYTEEGVVEDKVGLMIGWFANAIETTRRLATENHGPVGSDHDRCPVCEVQR